MPKDTDPTPEALVRSSAPAPGVMLLTLNRPDKLNALSKALLEELAAHLSRAAGDPGTACVILTGEGRAFAAGADISDMLERGVDSYKFALLVHNLVLSEVGERRRGDGLTSVNTLF